MKLNREGWLQEACIALKPIFQEKGYEIPKCHVSCGFASTDVRRGHIGQCWPTESSADQVNQIFISPGLVSPIDVLDTLVHELVHAVDDCSNKHGKEFKKIALKIGLKGPMRSAAANQDLKIRLERIAKTLGQYPHAKLTVPPKIYIHRKRPRAKCSHCGFTVPMLKEFIHYGPPICPKDKVEMEPLGEWD